MPSVRGRAGDIILQERPSARTNTIVELSNRLTAAHNRFAEDGSGELDLREALVRAFIITGVAAIHPDDLTIKSYTGKFKLALKKLKLLINKPLLFEILDARQVTVALPVIPKGKPSLSDQKGFFLTFPTTYVTIKTRASLAPENISIDLALLQKVGDTICVANLAYDPKNMTLLTPSATVLAELTSNEIDIPIKFTGKSPLSD